MPSGETHELRATDTIQSAASFEGTFYAIDSSNIIYVQDTGNSIFRAKMPDGSYYDFDGTTHQAARFTDRNGNYNEFHSGTYANGYWTDTLGRNIPLPVGQSAPTSAGTQTYEIPGLDGQAPIAYTLHWKQLKGSTEGDSALTDFNDSLRYYSNYYFSGNTWQTRSAGTYLFEGEFSSRITPTDDLFNPIVLTEIELPTGGSYKFSYNVWGEIDKVVYPTGGEETFTYNTVPANAYLEGPYDKANRGVVDRKVYEWSADPTPYEWTYTFPANGSRQITNPDGTKVETWYHQSLEGTGYGFDTVIAGMPYRQLAFTSDNHVVSQKLTHWTKTGIGSDGAEWHPRVDYEETIVYDSTGNGISATTLHEYNGDLGYKETPVLENKTTSYAFVSAANGSSLMPGGFSTMPSIPSATPTTTIRASELTYLIDDPNYAGIKSYYTNQNINGLVTVSKVKDGSGNVKAKTEIFYDEVGTYPIISAGTDAQWVDPGTNYRGNVTTTRSYYDITNSLFVATHAQYDNFGNLRKSWDGRGHLSQTDYSQTYAYAYPTGTVTQIPDPLGQKGSMISFTTATTYDYDTGLPLTTTDVNGQTTTLEYNDPLLRPTKVTAPNGQEAITEYGAGVSEATRYIRSRVQIDSTPHWKESYNWYDGLGRTYKTQSVDTVAGDEYVLTCYDNVGRVEKVSNPFRNLLTQDCYTANGTNDIYWTTNTFDDAGRPWKVTTPDGAVVETNYGIADAGPQIGTTVTVTDQAGKLRRSITNAVGHLTRVDEPNANNQLGDIDNPNQPTYYFYNTLDKLVHVQQGVQDRYFMYDALGRLLRVKQPEQDTNPTLNTSGNPDNNSWSIGYTYDNNSNILTTADAKGSTVTNVYDSLNRITARTYSDGTPTVDYHYDGKGLPAMPNNAKGKLVKAESSGSESRYTDFDAVGHLLEYQQVTDNHTFTSSYQYNLAGTLTQETYPSGRVVHNTFDANVDLSVVESKPDTNSSFSTYADSFTYNAGGAVTRMRLGNNLWETAQFNTRLQTTQLALGTTETAADIWKTDYQYGEVQTNGTVDMTKNNGNIGKQTLTVPGTDFVQAYKYDSLNRLTEAKETTGTTQNWIQQFGYDRYGNRTSFSQTVGNATTNTTPGINANTNRFSTGQGFTYDSNGNVTGDIDLQTGHARSFAFNGDNKQTLVTDTSVNHVVGQYLYGSNGERVKKITDAGATVFVYSAGKLIEEYSGTTLQKSYIYAGSRLLATEDANGTSYLTEDHLGSPRVITNEQGQVTSRRDFMPFGEELYSGIGGRSSNINYGPPADDLRQKFTGYERDNEINLDFTEARMYNFQHGRFTSTDPIIMSFDRAVDPQRINLYAYSRNNPLRYIDPDGEDILEPTGLSEEDQKAYEKWKAAYLATEAGRKTWDRYQNDKNFKLKIAVADRGSDSKNRSAKVDDFVFDGDGNFTGATMTLGRSLGKGVPDDSESYPVSSSLDETDSARVGASKIAHEFGHLDDFRSLGTTFYEQQKIYDAIKSRVEDLGRQKRYRELDTDPTLRSLNESFQKKFGTTTTQEGINRDNRAERQAIPTIRQIFGNSLSDRAKKAMTKLEKGN